MRLRAFLMNRVAVAMLILPLLPASTAFSQGKDFSRLHRDIDIMEDILDKMLQYEGGRRLVLMPSQTSGFYLPGFGVIFRVPGSPFGVRGSAVVQVHQGRTEVEVNSVRAGVKAEPAPEQSPAELLEPIYDFLGTYADAISQLKPDDKIMVVYNAPAASFATSGEAFVFAFGDETGGARGWSVWAKKKDIELFRERKINKQKFRSRIRTISLDSEKQNNPELRIMARVLETGLKTDKKNAFSPSGDVNFLYLGDFGACYFLEARYRSRQSFDFFFTQQRELEKSIEQLKMNLRTLEKSASGKNAQMEAVQKKWASAKAGSRDSLRTLVEKAYREFERKIIDYMLDYGRTVRILKTGQRLVVSMRTQSNYENIPQRVVFQIKKRDLDAYDRRKVSREAAAKRVEIVRYSQ